MRDLLQQIQPLQLRLELLLRVPTFADLKLEITCRLFEFRRPLLHAYFQLIVYLAKGRLRALELRDIACRGVNQAIGLGHRPPGEDAPRAVLVAVAVFKLQHLFSANDLLLALTQRAVVIIGMDKVEERPGEELLGAP